MNNEEKMMPIKTGDKTMVEILITDENKAFDFFGKAIYNKIDTREYGFDVISLSFSKDRYIEHIDAELRQNIQSLINNTLINLNSDISNLLVKENNEITKIGGN